MAFVVTEPCFGCKYTDCVVVCPCDCFREGEQMLFIDPDDASTAMRALPSVPSRRSTTKTTFRRNGRISWP